MHLLAFSQGVQGNPGLGAVRFAVQSLLFFAYWTYFESTTGQSIGKKLLKIKTTDLAGNTPDIRNIAIQRLWQGITATNRCVLWMDIYKRKETEAV